MSRIARVVTAALVGAGAMIVLVTWRGFFPLHASIVGMAVAFLAYAVFRGADQLRDTYRR